MRVLIVEGVKRESVLLCVFFMYGYDCTYKESLYSTYPYLTYSTDKSTSPVMKKYSTLGYHEKINIKAIAESVVAKSSVKKSFPLDT